MLRVCWQGAQRHRCLSAEGHCGILKAGDEDLVVRTVHVSHLPSQAALCHAVCRICRGRACFWREAIPSDNGWTALALLISACPSPKLNLWMKGIALHGAARVHADPTFRTTFYS